METEFQVNSNGGATYTVPIEVPPGTNGMAPELSLVYDSQQENGTLGVGWVLSGLSAISRTGATRAQDDFPGGIRFDANDRFALDGLRLIAIRDSSGRPLRSRPAQAAAYGKNGTVYHTENETWQEVVSHGSCGLGPCSFTVVDQDGLRLEYGTTQDSRIEAFQGGRADVMVWTLRRVTDLHGNYITVEYEENRENGFYFPQTIHYTGNTKTDLAPRRRVVFTYENRPDTVSRFIGGMLVRQDRRLAEIATFVGDDHIKSYRFAYELGASSRRSRMTSIRECGADDTCLPPTTFGRQDGPNGSSWHGRSNDFSERWADAEKGFIHGDYDGDGRDDILYPANDGGRLAFIVRFSQPNDRWRTARETFTDSWFDAGERGFLSNDYDGDGLTDMLYPYKEGDHLGLNLKRSQGDGTWISSSHTLPDRWHDTGDNGIYDGDFNADGLADLLMPFNDRSKLGFRIRLAGRDGRWTARDSSFDDSWFDIGPDTDFMTGDWNGDGLTDVLYPFNRGGRLAFRVKLAAADGSWASSEVAFSNPFFDSGQKGFLSGDYNGDGLTDILDPFAAGTRLGLRIKVSRGDGRWDEHSAVFDDPWADAGRKGFFVGDINGDGITDVTYPYAAGARLGLKVKLSLGNGQWTSKAVTLAEGWAESERGMIFGDFDGDGLSDLLYAFNRNSKISFRIRASAPRFEPADLMTRIENGFGGTTEIEYRPISDPAVYTKGNRAGPREADIQNRLYVAARYTLETGRRGQSRLPGDTHRYTYPLRYGGGVVDLDGRGWLGFREMTRFDPQLKVAETTRFHLRFPMSGAIEDVVLKDTSSQQTVERQTETYAVTRPFFGVTQLRAIEERTQRFQDGTPAYTTGTDSRYDPRGNPIEIIHRGDLATPTDDHIFCHRYDTHKVVRVIEVKVRSGTACNAFRSWDPASDLKWERYRYTDERRTLVASELYRVAPGEADGSWLRSTFAYDDYGNRVSETDPLGGAWTTTFDTTDHTFPSVGTSPANAFGEHLSATTVYHPGFGIALRETSPSGRNFETRLDSLGRAISMHGPDPSGRPVEITRIRYVADGPASYQETLQRTEWEQEDPDAWFWTREYFDGLSRVYRQTSRATHPSAQRVVDYGFDGGNRASFDSLPYFSSPAATPVGIARTYDSLDRLISERRPDGAKERYRYERGGLRTRITSPDPRQASGTDTVETVIEQDVWGRDTATRLPNGAHTTYRYDRLGRLVETVDPKGVSNNVVYNSLDQEIRKTNPHFGTVTQVFDDVGNLAAKITTEGKKTRYEYDALNRIVKQTVTPSAKQADADVSDTNKASAGREAVSWSYGRASAGDGQGRVSHIRMPGASYTYAYDPWGQPVAQDIEIEGKVYRFRYRHTPSGLPESTTFPDGSRLRNGRTVEGFLASVQLAKPSSSRFETMAEFSDFTALGSAGSTRFGNGVTAQESWDIQGRPLASRAFRPATETTFFDHHYQWNDADKLLEISDHIVAAQTRRFAYDVMGRLAAATGPFVPEVYDYDLTGNPLRRKDLRYTYDTDRRHQMVSGTGSNTQLELTYNRSGHVISKVRRQTGGATPRQQTSRFRYDGHERVVSVATRSEIGDTTVETSSEFAYDFDGRRLKRSAKDASGAETMTYFVTPELEANRLPDGRWINTRYIGGADGAVAAITLPGDGGSMTAAEAIDLPLNAVGRPGRLSTLISDLALRLLAFAETPQFVAGGLLALCLGLWIALSFVVLASRRPPTRWLRCRGSSAAGCVLLMLLSMFVPTLQPVCEAALEPGENGPGVPVEGLIFLHADHLGSTQLVTDSNGRITRVGFLPYGEINDPASSGTDDFRSKFSGEELLADSGLYAFSARLYDPELGRFLSPDPAGQFHSPYLYADGDPLAMVDPDGEEAISIFSVIAAVAVVASVAYTDLALNQGEFNPAHWDWSSGKTYIELASGIVDGVLVVVTGGSYLAGKSIVKGATRSAIHRLVLGTDIALLASDAYEFGKDPSSNSAVAVGLSAVSVGISLRAARRPRPQTTTNSSSAELAPLATGCASSFAAGTPVRTEAGSVPIQELAVGDEVWAHHEQTGETALFSVTELRTRVVDEVLALDTDNGELLVTAEHPFLRTDGRWVASGDLVAGDRLRRFDGASSSPPVERRSGTRQVFNIEVANAHTYFAGDGGFLVHNQPGGGKACRKIRRGKTRSKTRKRQRGEVSTANIRPGKRRRVAAKNPTQVYASRNDLFAPGPRAGSSIRTKRATVSRRQSIRIQALARRYGCHHCGRRPLPLETFIGDHMPVSSLNRRSLPQRLYPQCPQCSSQQGGQTARHLASGTYPPGY